MGLSNFHTHTTYCDGKNTPRELVEKAIELGCSQIGFSGHSYTETGDKSPYCMTLSGTEEYKAEIRRLKQEYRDKIRIFLGVERDYFSKDTSRDYDYSIGSVHYVYRDGLYLPVDESRKTQIEIVEKHYNGDFYSFAEDYYALVGDIYNVTKCDIVGHFDVITKYNEQNDLFDIRHKRYTDAVNGALEKLMNKGIYFEINYGAIARGHRTTPYPEQSIIDKLTANGEKFVYSSDCHDKNYLLFGIEKENSFMTKKRCKP